MRREVELGRALTHTEIEKIREFQARPSRKPQRFMVFRMRLVRSRTGSFVMGLVFPGGLLLGASDPSAGELVDCLCIR